MFLQPVGVAFLTTEIVMIASITLLVDVEELLDALDLEVVEEFDEEFDIDEDGVIWYYEEELDTLYYFDEDLDDWAEVDEDGEAWYVDEEEIVYVYDDEADEWVEYDESDDEDEDEDEEVEY
jgi:hypothetical protein